MGACQSHDDVLASEILGNKPEAQKHARRLSAAPGGVGQPEVWVSALELLLDRAAAAHLQDSLAPSKTVSKLMRCTHHGYCALLPLMPADGQFYFTAGAATDR